MKNTTYQAVNIRDHVRELTIIRARTNWLLLIVGLIFLFTLPYYSGAYIVHIVNRVGIFIIAAIGLNILIGYCGQISVGHTAFMAIGAYTSAILSTKVGFPFWVAMPFGALVAGFVGIGFGFPAVRLKGFYLLMATLAGQKIVMYIISHWDSMTSGYFGLEAPPAKFFGFVFNNDRSFYFIIMFVLALAVLFERSVIKSGIGRAFIAVRDNELAANVMGINSSRYKLLAFFIGCTYAGAAGALWAHWIGVICPEQFNLMGSIQFVGYLIVGGMGTALCPFLGVLALLGIDEVLILGISKFISAGVLKPEVIGIVASSRGVLFGLIIALFLIYQPRGLSHTFKKLKPKIIQSYLLGYFKISSKGGDEVR